MLCTGIIRLEPTIRATEVMEHTWAVGIPALSSSLTSTAPQRVLVPQVEVRIAPATPRSISRLAMACPMLEQLPTVLPHPLVE